MVKSCVGGGREESFSEYPDAVRIFLCGFSCADFYVRIFCCADFFCADFCVRVLDFCVRISVRILTQTHFEDFWQGDRRESHRKILQNILPKILPESLSEHLAVSPPFDTKNHGCTTG